MYLSVDDDYDINACVMIDIIEYISWYTYVTKKYCMKEYQYIL